VDSSSTQIQQMQIKLILTNPEVTPAVRLRNQLLTVTIKPLLAYFLRVTSKLLMKSIKILVLNRHGHNRHNNRKTLNNFLRHSLKLITVFKEEVLVLELIQWYKRRFQLTVASLAKKRANKMEFLHNALASLEDFLHSSKSGKKLLTSYRVSRFRMEKATMKNLLD
jgi:hypothetical protein